MHLKKKNNNKKFFTKIYIYIYIYKKNKYIYIYMINDKNKHITKVGEGKLSKSHSPVALCEICGFSQIGSAP